MHVFIDESGTFIGHQPRSISVVGALAIPDGNLPRLKKKYALLTGDDEVKGRDLDAGQIDRVVRLIKDRDAIFEVTALDLALHTATGVAAYQQRLVADMEQLFPTMPKALRERVAEASRYISQIPAQLFLQALVTFDLMHRMIGHSALFFLSESHTPWVVSIGSLTEKTPKRLPIGRTGLDPTREARWRACPRVILHRDLSHRKALC
ncbi:hypothetical protein [Bradyrhizobium sp. JR3.5]